jgi:hypothetical protein
MADTKWRLKLRLVNEISRSGKNWSGRRTGVGKPSIDTELEDRCNGAKTKIAQRKQLPMKCRDEFNCDGAIVKVLLGVPTLDLFKNQSPIIVANLRNVWHDAFIALNQLAGSLKIQMTDSPKKGGKTKKGSFLGRLTGRK